MMTSSLRGTGTVLRWVLIGFSTFGLWSTTMPSFMLVSSSAQFCSKIEFFPLTIVRSLTECIGVEVVIVKTLRR